MNLQPDGLGAPTLGFELATLSPLRACFFRVNTLPHVGFFFVWECVLNAYNVCGIKALAPFRRDGAVTCPAQRAKP